MGMEFAVYIAAPFNCREAARELRELLEEADIGCTSRWIDSHKEELDLLDNEARQREAEADLQDVRRADGLILIAGNGPSTSGGMHVEFGYAIGQDIPIWVYGGGQSIFHYLGGVTRCLTQAETVARVWEEFYGPTN